MLTQMFSIVLLSALCMFSPAPQMDEDIAPKDSYTVTLVENELEETGGDPCANTEDCDIHEEPRPRPVNPNCSPVGDVKRALIASNVRKSGLRIKHSFLRLRPVFCVFYRCSKTQP